MSAFNKVFGYFIEVSKGQAKQMPASFHRRQTLTNAERFISPELKEYEDKVLNAEERMQSLETELFHELRQTIAKQAMTVQRIALAVATIDALQSFAELAQKQNYVRPLVDRSSTLFIKEGRHPVVETTLPYNSFIPMTYQWMVLLSVFSLLRDPIWEENQPICVKLP